MAPAQTESLEYSRTPFGCRSFPRGVLASAVVKDINPYIGYGSICSKVPEGTDVATVFLHRPENIDAYIGRQITDYRKSRNALWKRSPPPTSL